MTGRAANLDTPSPPDELWAQIEKQLEEPTVQMIGSQLASASRQAAWSNLKYFVIAATLLMAVGVGWFTFGPGFGHSRDNEFAVEFGHYLEAFRHDPDAAQRFLLAKYDGKAVTADQAVQRVGYRPAVADGVPDGYSVESTYVMTMPCCTCIQTVCRRSDGSMIAVFEHDDEEAEWMEDRPTTVAQCGGKTCSLAKLHDHIAASWQRGKRHIALIGAQNIEEVDQFAALFN